MSARLIVLFGLIAVAQMAKCERGKLSGNPLFHYFENMAKQDPGSCQYDCVPSCYDDGYGSYNHRSGTCDKSGHSCCEWVVHGKRSEFDEEFPGKVDMAKRDPGSCRYDCVPSCYDDGYGSYNHRSGTCDKSGHSCCEWVVHGKRSEFDEEFPGKADMAKRDPGSCRYDCVPSCYDDGYGSYNHRSGTCDKSGHSCCEWVVHGKRSEFDEEFPGKADMAKRDPGSCQYDCVPSCYDDGYGSYNHRSGTCDKSGHSCCEWVVYGKRSESDEGFPGNMRRNLDYHPEPNWSGPRANYRRVPRRP